MIQIITEIAEKMLMVSGITFFVSAGCVFISGITYALLTFNH